MREETPEGVRLSWPGPSPARGTIMTVALALVGVAVVVGALLAGTVFREGTPYESAKYAVVAGLLILASFLATVFGVRIRRLFREILVVGPDAIRWSPAASASEMSGHFGWGGGGTMYGHSGRVARGLFHTVLEVVVLWRERESIRMTRSGITEIKVEGKGRFEHLSVAVGKAAIDVAKGLPHDDRAWLLDTLTRWREGAD
jgi:hypothetical protein